MLVQVREGPRFPARLGQMSIGGSFIDTDRHQPLATELTLLFRLPDSELEFVVSAVVRWCAPTGMGVQFGAMRGREIYELSRFLVDKATIPPPEPVPRSPVRAAPPAAPPRRIAPPLRGAEPTPHPPVVAPAAEAPAAAADAASTSRPAVVATGAKPPPLPPPRQVASAPETGPAPEGELETMREHLRLLDAVLAERDAELRAAKSRMAALAELEPLRAELSLRDAALAEREAGLRDARAALAEREVELRDARAALAEREAELRDARAALAERDVRVAALEAEWASATTRAERRDDELTQIHGIGPAFARALRAAGVHRFEQIAGWSHDDLARVARELKVPLARIQRYDWVGSAASLVADRGSRDGGAR